MALTITYLIMNMIRIYAIYLFIDAFLYKKRVSNPTILFAYGIYYCYSSFFYLKSYGVLLNMISNLFFGFAMGLLYDSKFTKRGLASVFAYSLAFSGESLAFVTIGFIPRVFYNELFTDGIYDMLGIVLSMASFLVLVIIFRPLFRNQDTELPYSYWLAVFIIPAGSIYILYILISYYVANTADDLSFILIVILLLFGINILVFYLYNKLLKGEGMKYENIMLHQQNGIYEKQALLIEEFQNDLHDQKHDMKNHLVAIKEFAECGKINELIPYVDALIGSNKEITATSSCGNLTIDAMLNSKIYIAKHQDTQLHTQVKLMAPLVINPVDLTIILGNLLDNALEACTRIPPKKRNIHFYLFYQHNFLLIQVKNMFDPSIIDFREGKAYTTKDNKKLHGIGLRRVRQAAEKYNGSFEYYTVDNDEGSFFVAEVRLYPSQ